MGMLPPDCNPAWDDCSPWTQANLAAYDQIRGHEENEILKAQLQ